MVEYFGRRILLMVSEAIMVLSLGFLGFYFYLKAENAGVSPEGWGFLPLTSLIVYTIAYSVGVGPVGYMIMGEILPHHVKGLAGCILTSAKWFMSFAMTKFFQDIINGVGYDGCYWLFGGFCALGFFYIYFFVPETKGKTLDEIQEEFADSYVAPDKRVKKGRKDITSSQDDEELSETGRMRPTRVRNYNSFRDGPSIA
jgi:facilitated trehalose transporter